jgi:hypothetical protein
MAKRKIDVRMRTYGVHSKWESDSKDLPRLVEVTTEVPARIDIEFGFVVNIKGAKNRELHFCIDHPGILDGDGEPRAPFDGSVFVKSNDWNFYLGDTIWDPITDKLGDWRMSLELDGQVVAEKTFHLYPEESNE